jgi:hypothetical protein
MTNKIIYFAPGSSMGDTSEEDAEKYRDWAYDELKTKFPDYDIEVADRESTISFWTNIDDVHINDKISLIIDRLWDEFPWD